MIDDAIGFRAKLIQELQREITGPDEGPFPSQVAEPAEYFEDSLTESPLQIYTAGILFPQKQVHVETQEVAAEEQNTEASVSEEYDEDVSHQIDDGSVKGSSKESSGAASNTENEAYDDGVRLANEFKPSALGATFVVSDLSENVSITPRAAKYLKEKGVREYQKDGETKEIPTYTWKRVKLNLPTVPIDINGNGVFGQEYPVCDGLELRILVRPQRGGQSAMVTATIVNTVEAKQDGPPHTNDCFFQVGFLVECESSGYVFEEKKEKGRMGLSIEEPEGEELAALDLLYRKIKNFGLGHGCAVDWGEEKDGKVAQIWTAVVPNRRIPVVQPLDGQGDRLNMHALAGLNPKYKLDQIPELLNALCDDYERWIKDRYTELETLHESHHAIGRKNLEKCTELLSRMKRGVDLLDKDEMLMTAFRYANEAMLQQQRHSKRKKRDPGDDHWEPLPNDYTPRRSHEGHWRTFQLAFVLMNIESIADENSSERDLVDLIWFPTGGGKTEAYLGLAALTVFLRRLRDPSNAGCTVLMRYTLRLLTAQQFQRASSLICAMEKKRFNNAEELGEDPISIGLWVGQGLTPNDRKSARDDLEKYVTGDKNAKNPFQLLYCPWCGTSLFDRHNLGYDENGSPPTVVFRCPEGNCAEHRCQAELPVKVIDEDIYDKPPTLIISTVDKFAMLAWRPQGRSLFGFQDNEADSTEPPALIIQDELHLISGPLGSMVGLYESAVDFLCSRGGKKPKIVASTATIRRSWDQIRALYNRDSFQFPPQGLEISDSYFATEKNEASGRVYVGVLATAASSPAIAARATLAALLQFAKSIETASNKDFIRDAYWTVVQYFNSIRELGRARTWAEADIPEYIPSLCSRRSLPEIDSKPPKRSVYTIEELTGRKNETEIPKILKQLENRLEDIGTTIDTLFATNMISVGVDVDRLGLMYVAGQPKTTSEYIQASSRVGRNTNAPGLVVTMYNVGKPRDRSHYENFRAYHDTFYKHVEPTSVTPFSLRVLERALRAVFVLMARQYINFTTPRDFHDEMPTEFHEKMEEIKTYLIARCESIDPAHLVAFKTILENAVKEWQGLDASKWGTLTESQPEEHNLMWPAGNSSKRTWMKEAWAIPTSLRNVDNECQVYIPARS